MKENNIKITENAQKQLESFKEELVRKLIDQIIKDKTYPGIEYIEITGNDIAQIEKQFVFVSKNKSSILILIAQIYLLFGVIVILCGFLYNEIKYIANNNPIQLIAIVFGLIMVVLSIFILLREKDKPHQIYSSDK